MMWLWLACSSQDMKSTYDAYDASEFDSGFYTDTGEADENLGDAEAPEIVPAWKKLSVNITEDTERWTAHLWEDLYSSDMTWLCQRKIEYGKVENLENPVEQISMWFQLSQPSTLESSCANDEGVQEQVQLGLGDLLQDIAVATEVTHWLEQDVSLETEQVWGAYVMGEPEQIWTFGVAFQPNEQMLLLRTVYSLPF